MSQKGLITPIVAIVILIIVVAIFLFLARPFKTPENAVPPFKGGELLLAEKMSYFFNDPKVGDRILFIPKDLVMEYVGVITNINEDNNVKTYTVVSTGTGQPWVITEDKIIWKIYFPSVSKEDISNLLTTQTSKVDETANWKTYKGNGFFFKHPNEMKITIDSSSETSWSDKYVDQDIPNQMMLKQQLSPFSPISIGGKVSFREYEVEVMSIDENEQIKLGDKIADSYIINCGVHCYYHIIRFQQNNIYYELTRDIAGGGLENSFQEILSTFEFTQ